MRTTVITVDNWDTTIGGILKRSAEFRYKLLSRMQMDCEFFLGYGFGLAKYLWAGDVGTHIEYMKAIWNSFDEKPKWLTMEQIEEYATKMRNYESGYQK